MRRNSSSAEFCSQVCSAGWVSVLNSSSVAGADLLEGMWKCWVHLKQSNPRVNIKKLCLSAFPIVTAGVAFHG